MSKEFNEAERALIAQISAKEQPTVLVDVDYYQTIIDDPEVSETEKRALIALVGTIIGQFIDIGWGVHPVQQALQDKDPPRPQPAKEMLPERSDA